MQPNTINYDALLEPVPIQAIHDRVGHSIPTYIYFPIAKFGLWIALVLGAAGGIYRGKEFLIANYHFQTGSGKSQQSHSFGCVKILLSRVVPNMILDATANNLFGSLTNLPLHVSSNQRLSLEGDFDSHFSLYCPKEYERDALYIFTPDLMSLLIDETSTYDIEVIDNILYLYSSAQFDVTDKGVLARLFHIIDVVGSGAEERVDDYKDERAESVNMNTIATKGQRLKRQNSALITGIIIIGLFVLAGLLFNVWVNMQ